MQNTNKILCNMSQSLTDAEKAQARSNIGAAATGSGGGYVGNIVATGSFDVDSTIEADHTYKFQVNVPADRRVAGICVMWFYMNVRNGNTVTISNDKIPINVYVQSISSGGGRSSRGFKGEFGRLNNGDNNWLSLVGVVPIDSTLVTLEISFDWPSYGIPNGAKLSCGVVGEIIG